MKKIIFLLAAFTLILSVFILAFEVVQVRPNRFSEELYEYHQIPINYHRGWNLIPLSTIFYHLYDAEEYNDPEAMDQWRYSWQYTYLPQENSYIGLKDRPDADPILVGAESLQDMKQKLKQNYPNPMTYNLAGRWVKFTEDVTINWYTSTTPELQYGGENAAYSRGWNFLIIPLELSTGELGMGDCDFDKLYRWDSASQTWQRVDQDQMKNMVGSGFIVHTNEECAFGDEGGIAPPALPD